MKRQREDPNSYLGGDIVASFEDPESDNEGKKKLTKAERNEARKAANKMWKTTDRKVGSGKDPNPRHTVYYQSQIPDLRDPEEWVKFQNALIDPLPVTFRIGGACPGAVEKCLHASMDNEFKSMRGRFVEINGVVLKDNIVKRIAWAGPNVWQIAADSATLARNVGLESLSKLLLREVSLGHVVRQELASMIPAIMLKVESHHNVLDVCAAPGSKTEQLLCLLNASRPDKNKPATGMVVANDADPIRINTLKKRYARAGSTNLMVTCARAEDLQKMINKPVFDRIVADVPCSGDGTIRKFPHIWRLFRPRMSLELHLVQLQIAIASVLLLKPGGRMVYSTCSINPLEDEAVVSALLRHYWGRLRLVDTKAEGLLPGLITRPGQSHWESSENIFVVGETDEAARKASLARLPKLTHSMKPPTTAEAEIMQLHHCHRILPQDNDTGGFFVAVLEWKPEGEVDSVYTSATAVSTGNVVYSLGKKQKAIVSAQASVDIMRNLGYNPKHTQNNNVATNPTTTSTNNSTSVVKTKTPAITASSVIDNTNTNSNSTNNTTTATTVVDEIDINVVYTTMSNAEYSSVTSNLNIDTTTVLPTTTTTTNNTSSRSLYLVQSQVTDTRATEQALLAQAKQREEIAKQGSYSGLFGSKAKGWAKPVVPEGEPVELRPITTTRISLVSNNIHTALTTWAAGAPTYLRQAGVAVADVSKSHNSDSGSSGKVSGGAVSKKPFSTSVDSSESVDDNTRGNVYSVIPDGAPALVNLISTTSVQNGDFGFVVKYALDAHTTTDTIDPAVSTTTAITTTAITTTANNAQNVNTTTDVTALFTQIATLSDPEYSADSMVDNINLEEAELQVAVVSGLSGEGLATLAQVYQEAVENVRSNSGNGGVVHVLVTGGSVSVTSGSASNTNNSTHNNNNSGEGEKRRLSKAERKKLKTGGNTTSTTAKTTAITTTTTTTQTDTTSITNTKPAVLLFRIASKNGTTTVTLVTPTDVLKSYSDAI